MHKVKCYYCGTTFDRDKEPFRQVKARRYAHTSCAIKHELLKTEEDQAKEDLEEYILKLFQISYLTPKIQKQISTYIKNNKYTYSGILKTLRYMYDIRGISIEKANGGIGLVPYLYNEAYDYYYNLDIVQKNNSNIMTNFVSDDIVIKIIPPHRNIKKKKRFSFLEENKE